MKMVIIEKYTIKETHLETHINDGGGSSKGNELTLLAFTDFQV